MASARVRWRTLAWLALGAVGVRPGRRDLGAVPVHVSASHGVPPAAVPGLARLGRGAEFLLLQAGPGNPRLPDWDTISTNPEMRRAAQELAHLRTSLGRN